MTELERVRQLVIDSAKNWRDWSCSFPRGGQTNHEGDWCDGDNHLEACACEKARQELVAALNKLDMVER